MIQSYSNSKVIANIKKVKTLGTGFFGKIILANTVGLSLKDL